MTNPILEAKISDIHSWWEVPCIAHFCSLFRASFNLIDFDIEDLEEALLTDDASDSGNTLIQELIVRLLRGYYGNNSISTFNYQMFLRRLFRQKCREFDCYNPFDNDMDFQFLPMRTKVEILHMLCDFRLDADDVLEILKDLDSDSLRVHPLGYDANKSAYWYFYGTRLYREDYPKKKKEKEKKRGRKRKRGRNKEEEESDEEEVELGSGIWQVVCFTESDWERLAVNTEDATDKNEQTLHQIIEEDFLPEIPKLFQEKERLQRKRFLELHPRKSSRIENLKRRKEEEMQYLEKYKRAFMLGSDSEADSVKSSIKNKNARHERWKNRNHQKEEFCYSDEDNSDSESLQDSVRSYNTQNGLIVGRGRQTNNSLSSATGEIIIHSTEKNRSPEWFDTKLDLHIGMYKVLNKLKEHDDSWPFLEPVDEEDAPNYYKVVKSPMSLQRMEDKLDSGKYKTLSEFRRDFHLILANCKQYNGSRNEYTVMGENLEKVFNSSVSRYITLTNSSDGEDVTESSDFPEVISGYKQKKRRRRKQTSSKSTEEADKENEQKLSSLDAVYSINSIENESRNADESLSIESRVSEQKPVKRGKGRPPKNVSQFDALEQTLRDINKWLDDTPKYPEFCSASNSPRPSNSPRSETAIEVSSTTHSEVAEVPKAAIRTCKNKDPATKKRSTKENHHKHLQLIKQRRRDRRDIQRTIDRLQPGKSKGNLISTISKTSTSRSNVGEEYNNSAKVKENATKSSENLHRPKPMLSLGSVLSHDIINLDTNAKKHTFSDNDSVPSDEEDPFSENDETVTVTGGEHTEPQAENLALDKSCSEIVYPAVDEKKIEEKLTNENSSKCENVGTAVSVSESTKSSVHNVEKSDKPTPNLSAWFKAFGAPKMAPKRKNESGAFNDNPATPSPYDEIKDDYASTGKSSLKNGAVDEDRFDPNEPPPPTPGRFFTYDEEKDQRTVPALPSPDMKPMRRQRKLSTGSSVSERSSFSQDPNDPMNSPHPSLDDPVYQSPQPYHQSPIHHNAGALKVGFYQDAFPKCGSDKSNSCSPREPMNSISPQHPMFSPRDSIASPRDSICSPRDVVTSPRGEPIASPREPISGLQMTSPRNSMHSPRYASVSPRDSSYSDAMKSPAPVYTPATEIVNANSASSYKPYKKDNVNPTEKSLFSIYPVKKRISAELEQNSRQQNEQLEAEKARAERPFVPVSSDRETEHFSPTPGCLPQHILPPNPYTPSETPSIPISLSHHHSLSHSFSDSYSENLLLSSNPYFRKDIYVSGQGMTPPATSAPPQSSHISPMFIQQQTDTIYGATDKLPSSQSSHYSPPRQSSPLVATPYGRNNVPLDYTAPTSTPLPLTSKANDYHQTKYHQVAHSESGVLNFSSKNPASGQHAYYTTSTMQHTPGVDLKSENEYQRSKLAKSPLQLYAVPSADACETGKYERSGLPAENVYHQNVIDLKHSGMTSSAPSYSNSISSDYFNSSKTLNYPVSDLRYPNYGASTNDDKQFYAGTTILQTKNHHHVESNYERSMELMSARQAVASSYSNSVKHGISNNVLASNTAAVSPNARYDISYHNRNTSQASESPTPKVSGGKKSKKKKAVTTANVDITETPQNASVYSHYQTTTNVPPQELKHNGMMPGSAFNFSSPAVVKNDYQQYLDNLRNSRYFAESAEAEKTTASQPVNNASFQFLAQRASPSFGLAAQAFMNANPPPCPPSIYSSPYLQRPPEELLRPMMLPQGLMSAHSGTYSHGYLNMHDPMNRSPWL